MEELSQSISLPTRPQEGEGEEGGGGDEEEGEEEGGGGGGGGGGLDRERLFGAMPPRPRRRGPAAAPLERKALERKRLSQKTATDGNSAKR